MNEKYLRLTLVTPWNLKGLAVEIHRCGCQRDCQMGNRARLPSTVSCPVSSYSSVKQRQKKCHRFWALDAVRRLSQEEELNRKPERLLRMRWVLTWKYTEGGDKKAKARLVILGYQHPELTTVPTAAPTLGKMCRHLLLQACALHKLLVHFGDVSSAFLQTSASEEHQDLTIKTPPEVGYLFSDSEGKPARYVRLMKSFCGLTSTPRAWWLDITQKLSQIGWKPMSTDQCLWCR